jgi:hypothetical protein
VFFTPKRRPSARRLLADRARGTRARREYANALTITGVVQAALAAALIVAAVSAYRAVQTHAPHVAATLRLALPALFALGAAASARTALANLRRAREERRAEHGSDPD